MRKTSKSPTQVVAALISRGKKILICLRPAHKDRGLLWEFPGGKVEPGESHEQALKRECQEELNLDITVGAEFMRVEHHYPDLSIELILYHATLVSGEPEAREHEELRWEMPENLGKFPFCPADKPMIEVLMKT